MHETQPHPANDTRLRQGVYKPGPDPSVLGLQPPELQEVKPAASAAWSSAAQHPGSSPAPSGPGDAPSQTPPSPHLGRPEEDVSPALLGTCLNLSGLQMLSCE